MDATARLALTLSLCLLASSWGSPRPAQAQPTLGTDERPSADETPDLLVDALGPWAGLVYDVTYGPGDGGLDAFALTATGIYRYRTDEARWELQLLAPMPAPDAPLPFTVDMVHLVDGSRAHEGFYDPQSVSLLVTAREFIVATDDGGVFRATRGGGPWTADRPPKETAFGPSERRTPVRLSVAPGRPEIDQLFLLRSDPDPKGGPEMSRLWQTDSTGSSKSAVESGTNGSKPGKWRAQDWPGRAVLIQTAEGGGGASWRDHGLTSRTAADVQVDRFLRVRLTGDGSTRLTEIEWASLLGASSKAVREGCGGATGMLEAVTSAGYDEPPLMVALGPRSVCVSTDGGSLFTVRGGLFDREGSLERVGDAISALAFAHKPASSGVRILVGTDEVFNPEGPAGRAFGGRLFMSDDAGATWQDVTPEIEGPGAFLGLAAGPPIKGERVVWLLTARRGLYRSRGDGLGFALASQGISAQPVHALAADPVFSGDVWAASPTGLYKYGSTWTRVDITSTRSLGTWPANAQHTGQWWAGTYRGSVIVRGRGGRTEKHELAPRDPAAPPIDLTTTIGELPRPVPLAAGVRPIILVVPTGLEGLEDAGYAVEQDAGIWRLSKGAWSLVPPPIEGPIRIQAMIPAPLNERHHGALMFTAESVGGSTVGVAWLHDPASGWQRALLPGGDVAQAAALAGGRVWLSTVTGLLMTVKTQGGKIEFEAPIEGEHHCGLLVSRIDDQLVCLQPPAISGGRGPGLKGVLARAWVAPLEDLRPGAGLGARAARWRLEAVNPIGAAFDAPVSATSSHLKDVGEHLWITPGIGVFARPVALDAVLPPEVDKDGEPSLSAWVAPVAIVAALVLVALMAVGWWRRRRLAGRALGAAADV